MPVQLISTGPGRRSLWRRGEGPTKDDAASAWVAGGTTALQDKPILRREPAKRTAQGMAAR